MDTIRRLGKSAEAIVDTLERAGGEMRVEDLAAELGIKRPRDMRRRVIARLEAAGVVECFGSSVRLCRDWLAALERRREEDEEIADYERDKKRYEREREDYRLQVEVMKLRRCGMEHGEIAEALEAGIEDVRAILGIPDYAPTEAEMEERRRNTPERRREAIETAVVRLFRERPEYGWPPDLPDDEILKNLLALNLERST